MTQDHANTLPNGVYRIYWNEGCPYSIGAIGRKSNGDTWFCPTNWISPDSLPSEDWNAVATVELISTENMERAWPTIQNSFWCRWLHWMFGGWKYHYIIGPDEEPDLRMCSYKRCGRRYYPITGGPNEGKLRGEK